MGGSVWQARRQIEVNRLQSTTPVANECRNAAQRQQGDDDRERNEKLLDGALAARVAQIVEQVGHVAALSVFY